MARSNDGTIRPRRATLLKAVMASGLLASAGIVATRAAFSDTETVTGNTWTTGTLDLALSTNTGLLSLSNLAPGDLLYAGLTVTNSGSLPLTYTLATTATNTDAKDLRSALTGEVKVVPGATCDATTFGASSTTYAPAVTGVQGLVSSVGRALAASGSERLCFKVTLPSTAGNALQGATTGLTFTFTAV